MCDACDGARGGRGHGRRCRGHAIARPVAGRIVGGRGDDRSAPAPRAQRGPHAMVRAGRFRRGRRARGDRLARRERSVGAGRGGLLVDRCEGGLLEAALRRRGGMPAPQALGVLDETLGLLDGSPAAPAGASRVAIRSVAVQRNGDLALIPARFRTGALRTDAAELGELLHLALTGSMWEETGLPLSETAPEVPAPVAALVTDLLDGTALTGGAVDRDGVAAMRARLARLGPTRGRGFLPAGAGVPAAAAPTGTRRPD